MNLCLSLIVHVPERNGDATGVNCSRVGRTFGYYTGGQTGTTNLTALSACI